MNDSQSECRRQHPRRRTRLRGGKLTDLCDQFLTECTIFDISEGGVGLLVPADVELPEEVLIYDDLDETLALARICWREDNQLGIAFEVAPLPIDNFPTSRLQVLKHKFYAVD